MKILVNYPLLAEELHLPVDEVVRLLLDAEIFDNLYEKYPIHFSAMTDDFETFFREWYERDSRHFLQLHHKISKLAEQNEENTLIIAELLPLLSQFIKKQDMANQLLTDLQEADAELHKQVTDVGTRITNRLAELQKKFDDFVANNTLMTNEDQAAFAAEIASIKNDAATLAGDAPDPTAPATGS